jgi:hypothetical protein
MGASFPTFGVTSPFKTGTEVVAKSFSCAVVAKSFWLFGVAPVPRSAARVQSAQIHISLHSSLLNQQTIVDFQKHQSRYSSRSMNSMNWSRLRSEAPPEFVEAEGLQARRGRLDAAGVAGEHSHERRPRE